MKKSGKSRIKCQEVRGNKKLDDTDEVAIANDTKVDIQNGNSPRCLQAPRVSGHSTPIGRKDYGSIAEDSSGIDYGCSPISIPCTQDGSNEITWDWQSPGKRSSSEKSKSPCGRAETPKRTKLLQRKRNANSPLLQKPLNRKQVKLENIENIGKLSAELKALTEKMRTMKQNEETRLIVEEENLNGESETRLLDCRTRVGRSAGIDSDMTVEILEKAQKSNIEILGVDDRNNLNYGELFDDSIDDSMIKCSWEIEEKLNLGVTKGNDRMELSMVIEEKELPGRNEKNTEYYATSARTTGSLKNVVTSKNSFSIDASSDLRTYSRNSSNSASTSNVCVASTSEDRSLEKCSGNSNVLNAGEGSVRETRKVRGEKNSGLFEIPDDSFDDCLAMCIEDEKLVSKFSEYDYVSSGANCNSGDSGKMSKSDETSVFPFTGKPSLGDKDKARNSVRDQSKNDKKVNTKETLNASFDTCTTMENRKFFKTKSLSDQYFGQRKNVNSPNKISKTQTRGSVLGNLVGSSVSTASSVLKSPNSSEGSNFPINVTENVHALDRSEGKDVNETLIVKYKSTGNLCNNSSNGAKDSQRVRCTPEEIERKRLEAKMRLEAKRKVWSVSSQAPVRWPVRR